MANQDAHRTDFTRLVGANLRRERTQIGMSQVALSARIGATNGTISRIERGYSTSLLTLERIADVLGIDPALLVVERKGK